MWHVGLRRQALALQAALDNAAHAGSLPADTQAIVDAYRDDLAVILAATDPDTAALLDGAGIETFDALRALLQRQ